MHEHSLDEQRFDEYLAMNSENIAFIGGGNMTRAIVTGLLSNGHPAGSIAIAEPQAAQRQKLADEFPGIVSSGDNNSISNDATTVVLAVKPQVVASVCAEIRECVLGRRPLILSIAAGVRANDIDRWLGSNAAVARVMPNQPALIGYGISAIYANAAVTDEQLSNAERILSAVGPVVRVAQETQIDAVTAISGSGPAYFYLLIDMMTEIGADLGLDAAVSRQLAIETARGAAELTARSDESTPALIARVKSPGGTTAAALDSLETDGVRDIFKRALTAAHDRAIALADQAHQQE